MLLFGFCNNQNLSHSNFGLRYLDNNHLLPSIYFRIRNAFEKGDFLVQYRGELITSKEARRRDTKVYKKKA